MNIAIIDADIIGKKKHRFPNLACMKISSYYKKQNDNVELKTNYKNLEKYDKVFISKVFTDTYVPEDILHKNNVEYGGTGFFYDKAPLLPYDIEHCFPDYDLYNNWIDQCVSSGSKEKEFTYYKDYSIGFLTRGCFRKCIFCVNKNYNKCVKHSNIHEFINYDRPKLCFLDDNFFACKEWEKIIKEVIQTNKKFQFKQGLDERLLDEYKIQKIFSWKYDGDYIFAFDDIKDKDIIKEKSDLIRKYTNKKNIKFYVFCGYDRDDKYDLKFWEQDIEDLFQRINILSYYNFKPYIMRHKNYHKSPYRGMYINIASWCNQPQIFFNHSFRQFCIKDDNRRGGLKKSSTYKYMNDFYLNCPNIANKFYDIVPNKINHYKGE